MKVLVIGGGGREHALAWKLSRSPLVTQLFAAPGNPGIGEVAECVDIDATDLVRLANFARDNQIDLTVVGPEAPLVAGIVDHFKSLGMTVFGPSAKAALLEGSKIFTKELMRKHRIPTARFKTFEAYEAALAYVKNEPFPLVVKADGLAAGKGVFVCATVEEATSAIARLMRDRTFGDAGDRVLIEDCLIGQEASILAFTDGRNIAALETSQDHKALNEGDTGPNTGGMGAYSPAPIVTDELFGVIEREVLVPTIHGMNVEDRAYSGLLYAGLMMTDSGPQVLEYNCRFGDPEAQPILMRLKSDLAPILMATAQNRLDQVTIEWDPRPAVCVVLASGGYPGNYDKGYEISGLDQIDCGDDLQVFHAGTKMHDGKLVTSGGRVLGVCALGETIRQARDRAYAAVEKIHFEKCHYRKDIAAKAIN